MPHCVLYKLLRLLLGALLAALPLAGLAYHSAARPIPIVVTADWLQENRDMPKLLLVDARSTADYAQGHLPGAINLPVDLTITGQNHNRLPKLSYIRELFRQTGLHNDDLIVIYDDGLLKNAARLFWVLETYGHSYVAVLDGGLPGWEQAGHALSREPVHRPPSHYVPSVLPHHLATRLTTRLAIDDPDVVIIDARRSEEYLGLSSQAERAGHIPGAINLPWEANLVREDGAPHLLSDPELQHLYNRLKGKRIITYCNRGKESAVTYLMLRHLGYPVSIYDGSWLDWGNDPQLPIARGDSPGTANGRE